MAAMEARPDARELLHGRLQRTMVELEPPPMAAAGRLSNYGAGCVLEAIEMAGFKIVKESP
jgi:hypothetical protein